MKYILSSLIIIGLIACSPKPIISKLRSDYKLRYDKSIPYEDHAVFFTIIPVKYKKDTVDVAIPWDYVEPYMDDNRILQYNQIANIQKDLKGKRFNLFNKNGLDFIIVK